ncbi:hypothetical protein [Dyella ginsengisoli]|uniref:hypothetical protein n=1 Tax=Dyella ginsengisoli TaxID=363848 RepID=UPI0003496A2B|nr:hypothetical protein [Dyella ginsengisoli]
MRIAPESALELWECVVHRPPAQRDMALLGAMPRSLTERNALALQRYAALVGASAELLGRCPECDLTVEFAIDVQACRHGLMHERGEDTWQQVEADGASWRFRLPVPSDLYALESIDDDLAFARALLGRCVEGGTPASLPACEAISRRIEELAPGAGLHFALTCPACGHGWNAPLDPVELLWRELRDVAEQLLAQIGVLASRWGWSESDILRLSPIRRAAYLQLAGA